MRKNKGYIRKVRNAGTRQLNRVLLVSAEGVNKTEQNYFRHLGGGQLSVRFAGGNDTDPVRLAQHLREAFEEYNLTGNDLAVCFIDTDFNPKKNEQIRAAEKIVKQLGSNARVVISCPCFEIWFICHFTYTTRHYSDNDAVINFLRKYIPEYTKAGLDFFDRLADKQATAVKNAKALEEHCHAQGHQPHTVDFHPSTEAYAVIEWISEQMLP